MGDHALSTYSEQSAPHLGLADGGRDHALVVKELQTILDGIPEFAAVVSRDGTILLTNHAWDRELRQVGSSDFGVGSSYPVGLAALIEAGDERVKPVLEAFGQISAGTRRSSQHICFAHGIFSKHDYKVRLSAFDVAGERYVLVNIQDVTEVNKLKRQKRRFDSAVLKAQERERRRMARELHDSTSQLIVELQFNLMNLAKEGGSHPEAIASECKQVVQAIHREIRSISYIAHPPSLSRNGLSAALKTLAGGFGARAGLDLELQICDVGRASASVEAAIYRLAQEALSNIHHHASASRVAVRLVGTDRCIHLVISDDGIGFDVASSRDQPSIGVGIVGMEERVRELKGRFSIRRIAERTVLSASLPRWKSDAAS